MPKVSEDYKEEKRDAILDGALSCFARTGYEGTTIEGIAQYLGISKGAIYTYFPSKEDLYVQLMEKRMDKMIVSLRERFSDVSGAEVKLRMFLQKFVDQPLEDLRRLLAFHLEFSIHASRREELQAVLDRNVDKAFGLVREIVEEGKGNGEFRQDADVSTATHLFWAIRDGIALQFMGSGMKESFDRLIRGMEEMLLMYLK